MEKEKRLTYHQIVQILKSDIEDRKSIENEKFCTEREIMERFGVSRMTARQVINELVAEGVLYRIKGRGAFIHKRIIQKSSYIHSFSERMKGRGMKPSSCVLAMKKMLPPEIARLSLELEEGELCYFIKRLRYADAAPMAVESVYTPVEMLPGLEKYDFEQDSFYRILREEYGKEFGYDKELISAVMVDGEIARFLYEKENYIALKIVNVLYDDRQKPLEYSESWYHADQYSYLSVSVRKGSCG